MPIPAHDRGKDNKVLVGDMWHELGKERRCEFVVAIKEIDPFRVTDTKTAIASLIGTKTRFLQHTDKHGSILGKGTAKGERIVSGSIVNEQDLHALVVNLRQTAKQARQETGPVVDGDDDGYRWHERMYLIPQNMCRKTKKGLAWWRIMWPMDSRSDL